MRVAVCLYVINQCQRDCVFFLQTVQSGQPIFLQFCFVFYKTFYCECLMSKNKYSHLTRLGAFITGATTVGTDKDG